MTLEEDFTSMSPPYGPATERNAWRENIKQRRELAVYSRKLAARERALDAAIAASAFMVVDNADTLVSMARTLETYLAEPLATEGHG